MKLKLESNVLALYNSSEKVVADCDQRGCKTDCAACAKYPKKVVMSCIFFAKGNCTSSPCNYLHEPVPPAAPTVVCCELLLALRAALKRLRSKGDCKIDKLRSGTAKGEQLDRLLGGPVEKSNKGSIA
jgi:hypothetical protein